MHPGFSHTIIASILAIAGLYSFYKNFLHMLNAFIRIAPFFFTNRRVNINCCVTLTRTTDLSLDHSEDVTDVHRLYNNAVE